LTRSDAQPGFGARYGRYTTEALLHRGRKGHVYRARGDDGVVALRVVDPSRVKNPVTERERFLRCARAVRQVASPHLVTVFEAGVELDSGELWLAMELVEGTRLDVLMGGRPAPRDELFVLGIGAQLARAIGALHARGVVHRNIKPSNALVELHGGFDPFVHLVGFSLMKTTEETRTLELTRKGEVIGTPAYLSPEALLDSSGVGRSADVYSFGVVLAELLTAELPFAGASLVEQLMAKQEQAPRVESETHTAGLVRKLLARDPSQRPTMGDVLEEIEEMIETTQPDRKRPLT
jgi:serine/threonine protein kinase